MRRTIGIIILGILNVLTLVLDFFIVWLLVYVFALGVEHLSIFLSIIIVTVGLGGVIVKWVAFYYIVKHQKIKWLRFYLVYSAFILLLLFGFRFLSLLLLFLFYLLSIFLIFYDHKQTTKKSAQDRENREE